jgi:hypothetical protein
MDFAIPQGIGDSVWALTKIQSIRDALDPGGKINIHLSCGEASHLESRALDFVRRFRFVDSVEMAQLELRNSPVFRPDGCWNYIPDGMYEFAGKKYCVLIPNETLERGERLESWLPHHSINWDIFRDFTIHAYEHAFAISATLSFGPYCVFYPGPLGGNTVEGHNRGMLWRPADWITLGEAIRREWGLHIVVVGAAYDASYYDTLIAPNLNGSQHAWTSLIGATSLGELWAVTNRAKFVISYQAGVGIISTLLRTPTAIWWRPQGNSISSHGYLSFNEHMASSWVPPDIISSGAHLPLIYSRHDVPYILGQIRDRGWIE